MTQINADNICMDSMPYLRTSASSVDKNGVGIADTEAYSVIGAAMRVHRELGCGFLEPVYQEAFERELIIQEIPDQRELEVPVWYRGQRMLVHYRADFVCFKGVIVELKALSDLSGSEEAQIINYLKATKCRKGLLINFGTKRLQYKRFVFTSAS